MADRKNNLDKLVMEILVSFHDEYTWGTLADFFLIFKAVFEFQIFRQLRVAYRYSAFVSHPRALGWITGLGFI